MKIIIGLGWVKGSFKNYARAFKDSSCADLFKKYLNRIEHDFTCEVMPMPIQDLKNQTGLIWLCERSKKSRMLSSEDLSGRFQKICESGAKSLTIWVGGPDGISPDEMQSLKAELIWSFGPLTLPHELASVVALEQVYRAISITKGHPYHCGH